MSALPDTPTVASATFKVLDGQGPSDPIVVQFNPATLEYTISNEFDDRNGNAPARQVVKKSTSKLTMTLVFDTTDVGTSVHAITDKIAAFLPRAPVDGSKPPAPKIEFGWGAYKFQGVAEQFKETIDFFSADGVPLRSSIALTLSGQETEFQGSKDPQAAVDRNAQPDPVSAPAGASPSDLSNSLGDPRAARAIASANGAASLRFGGDAGFGVGGGVTLSAAASFSVGASANLGLSAGAGIGIGGAAGIGVSAGAGIGASAGIGIGASVGSAGSTSFAGLRVTPPSVSVNVIAARAALLPPPRLAGAAVFGPGGRATVQAGASLGTDVGATASLHARIDFGA